MVAACLPRRPPSPGHWSSVSTHLGHRWARRLVGRPLPGGGAASRTRFSSSRRPRPSSPSLTASPTRCQFYSRGGRCCVACSVSTRVVAERVARLLQPGGRLAIVLSVSERDRVDGMPCFGAAEVAGVAARWSCHGLSVAKRPSAARRGDHGAAIDVGAPPARRPRLRSRSLAARARHGPRGITTSQAISRPWLLTRPRPIS